MDYTSDFLFLLCSGAELFSSPVNFSVVTLGLSVSMQRGGDPGSAHFFPSHGFPLPLSVPLRPPGNSPKEKSKIFQIILTKYGLNERRGKVVWFSTAKKMGNGGARAGRGSSLQIFESLQQRVESVNYLGFVSGLQQVRGGG